MSDTIFDAVVDVKTKTGSRYSKISTKPSSSNVSIVGLSKLTEYINSMDTEYYIGFKKLFDKYSIKPEDRDIKICEIYILLGMSKIYSISKSNIDVLFKDMKYIDERTNTKFCASNGMKLLKIPIKNVTLNPKGEYISIPSIYNFIIESIICIKSASSSSPYYKNKTHLKNIFYRLAYMYGKNLFNNKKYDKYIYDFNNLIKTMLKNNNLIKEEFYYD